MTTAKEYLKDKGIRIREDALHYSIAYSKEDVLYAIKLKEQEVLASLKAELEGKSGADMLNETIIRTIEEPRKIEEAKQQAKQELWDDEFVRYAIAFVYCMNDINEFEKRHNLK